MKHTRHSGRDIGSPELQSAEWERPYEYAPSAAANAFGTTRAPAPASSKTSHEWDAPRGHPPGDFVDPVDIQEEANKHSRDYGSEEVPRSVETAPVTAMGSGGPARGARTRNNNDDDDGLQLTPEMIEFLRRSAERRRQSMWTGSHAYKITICWKILKLSRRSYDLYTFNNKIISRKF